MTRADRISALHNALAERILILMAPQGPCISATGSGKRITATPSLATAKISLEITS